MPPLGLELGTHRHREPSSPSPLTFPPPSTAARPLSRSVSVQRPGDPARSPRRFPAPGRPRSPTGHTGRCHQRCQPQGPAGPATPPHVRHQPPLPGRGQMAERPARRLTDSLYSQSASGIQSGWAGLRRADQSPAQRRPCHRSEQSAVRRGRSLYLSGVPTWPIRSREVLHHFPPRAVNPEGAARRRSQLAADSANRSAKGREFAPPMLVRLISMGRGKAMIDSQMHHSESKAPAPPSRQPCGRTPLDVGP